MIERRPSQPPTDIAPQGPTTPQEAYLCAKGTSPNLHRYVVLLEMAQDQERPIERRDMLRNAALHMVENSTNIEGVHFMPEIDHRRFMRDLATYGSLPKQNTR